MAAIGLALASAIAAAAEPPATLTLLEGQAALLRGTSRYALAEGVRLQPADIVEVGGKGSAQIEFGDGLILSLGPGARFYAGALTPRGGGVSDLYLLRGWSKFAGRKGAAPFRYTTPAFGIWAADATAVVQITEAESSMFVETGEVRIAEGFAKASPASAIGLKGGEYMVRKPDESPAILPRPGARFVAAMPKSYMDNLPSRMAKYKEREVIPQRTEDLAYADVEMWLKAPSEIRRPIMQRFIPEAKDPVFRQALIANLKFHPEWDPILFPEKYKPKPPPAPPRPKPVVEPPRSEPVQATPAPPVHTPPAPAAEASLPVAPPAVPAPAELNPPPAGSVTVTPPPVSEPVGPAAAPSPPEPPPAASTPALPGKDWGSSP